MGDYFERLLADPTTFHDAPYDEAFRLPREQIDRLQLEGARKRFAALRPGLIRPRQTRRRAEASNRIETIEDLAPLLFPHTVYKSYPISYLERVALRQADSLARGTHDHRHFAASMRAASRLSTIGSIFSKHRRR